MSEQLDLCDSRLHAFIDGELPEQESAAIAAEIAGDSRLAGQAARFRADKDRLHEIYGQIADAPVPHRWIEMIESHARRSHRPLAFQGFAALAASLMILVGGSLVYRQMTPHEEPIVGEALAARLDSLPARQIIRVKSTAEVQAARNVLASALEMRVGTPDLSRMGYKLVGLRIYNNVHSGKAAELVYRHPSGRIFALYLRHPSGAPRFDQYKQGNLRVCIWQDDVIGAVMTGEMSAAEMQRLASLAYTGLES